jgi:hypothetical protein
VTGVSGLLITREQQPSQPTPLTVVVIGKWLKSGLIDGPAPSGVGLG